MAKIGQHVVPNTGGWSVKRSGATKASSVHRTQAEAIEAAKRLARKQGGELYIHGRDGRIIQRSSFGSEPFRSRG